MIPNGIFTIKNPEGEYRTFQIKTQPKDSTFQPGQRIVALLTGADNEHNYTGFGFVKPDGIRIWNKRAESKVFPWYARLICAASEAIEAFADQENPEVNFMFANRQYNVLVSKRCCLCNRRLTTPESIRLGIGPVCAGGGRDGE